MNNQIFNKITKGEKFLKQVNLNQERVLYNRTFLFVIKTGSANICESYAEI